MTVEEYEKLVDTMYERLYQIQSDYADTIEGMKAFKQAVSDISEYNEGKMKLLSFDEKRKRKADSRIKRANKSKIESIEAEDNTDVFTDNSVIDGNTAY